MQPYTSRVLVRVRIKRVAIYLISHVSSNHLAKVRRRRKWPSAPSTPSPPKRIFSPTLSSTSKYITKLLKVGFFYVDFTFHYLVNVQLAFPSFFAHWCKGEANWDWFVHLVKDSLLYIYLFVLHTGAIFSCHLRIKFLVFLARTSSYIKIILVKMVSALLIGNH